MVRMRVIARQRKKEREREIEREEEEEEEDRVIVTGRQDRKEGASYTYLQFAGQVFCAYTQVPPPPPLLPPPLPPLPSPPPLLSPSHVIQGAQPPQG